MSTRLVNNWQNLVNIVFDGKLISMIYTFCQVHCNMILWRGENIKICEKTNLLPHYKCEIKIIIQYSNFTLIRY